MSTKTYKLPMSASYVRHWGLSEAIRELLQNHIDSPESGSLTWGKDSLSITNNDITIPSSSLVLGGTTKADNDQMIGAFGEGFKLALLVLVRLGYGVKVLNGDFLWSPYMATCDQFGAEILHIDETHTEGGLRNLSFVVDGLTKDDRQVITDSCLLLQKPDKDLIQTPFGQILPSRGGELFVGGLHICSTELKFGYNFNPDRMRLERDRQTVSSWDLKYATKDIWYATEQWDRIAIMMRDKVPDLDMAEHYNIGFVKEACYKLFMKENPNKIVAKSQEELDRYVKAGMAARVVYISSSSYANNITSHKDYRNTFAEAARVKTPAEELQAFFDNNSPRMKLEVKTNFQKLIESAKDWRK
jgi:hypothetical protein